MLRTAIGTVVLCVLGWGPSALSVNYSPTELPVPAGYIVTDISLGNSDSVVASGYNAAVGWRALRWVEGNVTVVEAAGASGDTFLWDINNAGLGIGSTPTATTGPRAATLSGFGGGWSVFATGAGNASGRGINDAGATTGFNSAGGWYADPAGNVTFIPPVPGDLYTFAFAINNLNEVAAWSGPDAAQRRMIRWSPSDGTVELEPYNADLALYSVPSDINDDGFIAGGSLTAAGSLPLIWHPDGSFEELPLLDADDNGWSLDINAAGEVIGYSGTVYDTARPVLWDAVGTAIDLSGELPAGFAASGYGMALSDSGKIAVSNLDFTRIVLLIPEQAGAPGQQSDGPPAAGDLPEQSGDAGGGDGPPGATGDRGIPPHANGKGPRK